MNDYKLATPRAALGLTAVAMAALTIGVFVVLPAKLDSVSADPYTAAAAKAATRAPLAVVIRPAHSDVPEAVDREEHVHAARTTLRRDNSATTAGTRARVAEPTLDPHHRTFNTEVRAIELRSLAKERS